MNRFKFVLIISVSLYGFGSYAQNLVPDPGFENWNNTAGGWLGPLFDYWEANGTPDHHHEANPIGNNLTSADPNCTLTGSNFSGCGSVYAGQGCLGFWMGGGGTGTREWAATSLTSPTVAGECYRVSFWVQSKKNNWQSGVQSWIDGVGVMFSNDATPQFNPSTVDYTTITNTYVASDSVIMDTIWHYIEMQYVADAAYSNIFIGVMGNWGDLNTTYMWSSSSSVGPYFWLDELTVEPLTNCCINTFDLEQSTNENCGASDGTITVDPTGTSPYTYTLYTSGGTAITSNATGTFTGLPAGDYYVEVSDGGTCIFNSSTLTIIDTGVFPDAGSNGATTLCQSDPTVDLFTLLGSTPQSGGTWSPTLNSGTGIFDPGVDSPGTYTYDVTNSCGTATADVVITVNASDDATFNYAQSTYCLSDPNPTPVITGLAGGTFSIENSGVIDPVTGEINIALSGINTFSVIYQTNGICPASDTISITITNQADATITNPGNFCANDPSIVLSATDPGGVWSGPGVTDPNTGAWDPAVAGPGMHTIDYVISGNCGDSDAIQITVTSADDATFAYGQNAYCTGDTDPTANIQGTSGGTFSINPSGTIDPATGEIDLDATGSGTFTVSYITNGPCPDSLDVAITISDESIVSIDSAGPFCEDDPSSPLITTATGGTWSGPGVNATTGQFDPSVAGTGTHQIIYTVPGNCGDADTILVTVNPLPIVDAGSDQSILLGDGVTISATGAASYTWDPPTGLSCTNCQSPFATPTVTTEYTVTGIDDNSCSNIDVVTITLIAEEQDLFVPNIFSPNGDNHNDQFVIEGTSLNQFNIQVFNRWGELVFESDDQSISWDGTQRGKELNTAVFAYVLTYIDSAGVSQKVSGNVTLIK